APPRNGPVGVVVLAMIFAPPAPRPRAPEVTQGGGLCQIGGRMSRRPVRGASSRLDRPRRTGYLRRRLRTGSWRDRPVFDLDEWLLALLAVGVTFGAWSVWRVRGSRDPQRTVWGRRVFLVCLSLLGGG